MFIFHMSVFEVIETVLFFIALAFFMLVWLITRKPKRRKNG